jgi:uncharacterized delta-60 repeat protein
MRTRRGGRRLAGAAIVASLLLVFPLLAIAKPGALDKGFGEHGTTVSNIASTGSGANRVVVMPGGAIVAAGMGIDGLGEDSDGDFAVAGYTEKGALDTGFATKGANIFDFGEDYVFDVVHDLAVTDDGKILVGGLTFDGTNTAAGIARLKADGSLDDTLGGDGTVTASAEELENAVALLPLPGGAFYVVGPAGDNLAIARFTEDGTLDASFAGDGVATYGTDRAARVGQAILTEGGKIVAVAYTADVADPNFGLLRFNADGTLDATFGDGGLAQGVGKGVTELSADEDGNLVAAGARNVARFDADGQPDVSFADHGAFEFSSASGFTASGLALDPDGKIVLSGSAAQKRKHKADRTYFAVARLKSNGKLDRKFGKRGFAVAKFGSEAPGVGVQDDGKIVAAGRTLGRSIFIGDIAGRDTNFALARFLAH